MVTVTYSGLPNDVLMSLVNGGLFDINHNWQQPHMEHREGRNADVRTEPSINIPSCSGKPNAIPNDGGVRALWLGLCDDNNVPPECWGILEDIFRNNGDLDPTHEIAKNHWHLVL